MAIVSSTYKLGHPQASGQRYVVETHTDSTGAEHGVEYGPVPVIDYAAVMAERAVQLSDDLAAAEAEALWL